MNLSTRVVLPLVGSIALLLPNASRGADLQKAANTNALNTAASWTVISGVDADGIPDADDNLIWNSVVTAPNISPIGAIGENLSVLGIQLSNVGGTRNNAANYVGITGATSTLTIGTGGIDMLAALQPLRIDTFVTLGGGNQTWNVADATTAGAGLGKGEDLLFFAPSAAAPINLGTFTLNKTGAGTMGIGQGYTISNGTLNVNAGALQIQSGSSRVTTLSSNLTLNVASGAALRITCESGAGGIGINSAAPINLAAGSTFLTQLNQNQAMNLMGNITANGSTTWLVQGADAYDSALATFSGSLLGSGDIAYQNTIVATALTGFIRMTGNNSGYGGTFTLNGGSGARILRLSGANAGSASATWSVGTGNILQIDGVSVNLGTLTGAGTVNYVTGAGTISVGAGNFAGTLVNGAGTLALTKVGAGTLTLTGANTYTGATTVNGGTLLTTSAHTGASNITVADGAAFGVNVVTAGTTFTTPNLTTGATTGAAVHFNLGTLGNPSAPVINATTFTPTAATTLRITGSNFTNNVQFTLLDYAGALGGTGFAGLSLALPFRVSGNLVDNSGNTSVDAVITASSTPVWRGTLNNNWNIDTVGDGSTGTANWLATSGPNTYVEAPVGSDSVIFDDSVGAGPTSVNLTTTLAPNAVTVNNTTVNYTWGGSGKLSGATGLTKSGTGTLTIANTTANDYAGVTDITAGKITVGDGVTAGAGSVGVGTVVLGAAGTLEYNRPDNFSLSLSVSGAGILRKANANTLTLTNGQTHAVGIDLAGGTLAFSGGGTLSGVVSGSGGLTAAGGTLQLAGAAANTNTGLTTVSAGQLQLNKPVGTNAVGGDITITGTGQLSLLAGEQVPDTATITLLGTSIDSLLTIAPLVPGTPIETVANVVVNSATPGAPGGQVILRNNFVVTGTGTVNSGILGIASGHTATINAVNITGTDTTSAILRIAGSATPSTLNVGAGGITASGGEIQVKFNTNLQDATLNLGGDFTATGNVNITNGGFTGANINVVNLTGPRTFNIAGGTTTTVSPDLGGGGALIKTGAGTLALTNLVAATYTGDTTIGGGTLLVHGTITGSANVNVNTGTLAGTGTISSTINVGNGTGVADATISPGASLGTLAVGNANFASDAVFALEINTDGTPATDLLNSTGTVTLGLGVATLTVTNLGATVITSGETLTFISAASVVGEFAAAPDGTILAVGANQFEINYTATSVQLIAVPEPGSAALLLAAASVLGLRRRRV